MERDKEEKHIRTFIAIELPDLIKEQLKKAQSELQSSASGHIRWVKPELMHLTLRFIGNIEEHQIERLAGAIKRATMEIKPFKLTTNKIGAFPDLKKPKLIYIGLCDSCQLTSLSDRINAELKALELVEDTMKYQPHLTLCRVRKQGRIDGLKSITEQFTGTQQRDFTVHNITLFKSVLGGKSPEYTVLRRIALN